MAKFIQLALALLWALAGIAGLLSAMFSVMMFDAPGATERPATIALALSVMSFPFACFFAAGKGWAHRNDRWQLAHLYLLLPFINLATAGTRRISVPTVLAGIVPMPRPSPAP